MTSRPPPGGRCREVSPPPPPPMFMSLIHCQTSKVHHGASAAFTANIPANERPLCSVTRTAVQTSPRRSSALQRAPDHVPPLDSLAPEISQNLASKGRKRCTLRTMHQGSFDDSPRLSVRTFCAAACACVQGAPSGRCRAARLEGQQSRRQLPGANRLQGSVSALHCVTSARQLYNAVLSGLGAQRSQHSK